MGEGPFVTASPVRSSALEERAEERGKGRDQSFQDQAAPYFMLAKCKMAGTRIEDDIDFSQRLNFFNNILLIAVNGFRGTQLFTKTLLVRAADNSRYWIATFPA